MVGNEKEKGYTSIENEKTKEKELVIMNIVILEPLRVAKKNLLGPRSELLGDSVDLIY